MEQPHDGYGPMMAWGWMWLFWALIVLGVVLLVLLAMRVFRGSSIRPGDERREGTSHRPLTARQILDQRYAKGEIDTEEYQERLKHLAADR